MRNLKQALNHGLVFKKDYRVIKVNRNAWLKPYINMNRDLTKKKMCLEKLFSVDEQCHFWKNYGECEKKQILTFHNRKKKELFSIRAKLSYYKVSQRTSISNRNEKNQK